MLETIAYVMLALCCFYPLILGIKIVEAPKIFICKMFGNVEKILRPGYNWVWPFISQIEPVYTMQLKAAGVEETDRTKDGIHTRMKCDIFFQIDVATFDVDKAKQFIVISDKNDKEQKRVIDMISSLVKSSYKEILPNYTFNNLDVKKIGDELKTTLNGPDKLGKYGFKVNEIPIIDIEPTDKEIRDFAQNEAKAIMLTKAVDKENELLVKRAKGEADAKREKAEGDSAYITKVGEATAGAEKAQLAAFREEFGKIVKETQAPVSAALGIASRHVGQGIGQAVINAVAPEDKPKKKS
jgi:regulator of protease activity HflC (stomatin/prohibitin superfamily)